jgi:hypothetical protein
MFKFYTNLKGFDEVEIIFLSICWAIAFGVIGLNLIYGNFITAILCTILGYGIIRWYYGLNKKDSKD